MATPTSEAALAEFIRPVGVPAPTLAPGRATPGRSITHVREGPGQWACASSTPSRVAMRPVRWMLPTCGRGSKPMSPVSGPRVSGCRSDWSRPCRCRHAPDHTGPLQLRRTSTGHPDPGPAASRGGPSACPAPAGAVRRHAHNSTRIVEGPTGTGPATWPRGRGATWHRASGHMAVGAPLPTQTPAVGSGGELDSGHHQAGAGPAPAGAAPCRRSDPRRRRPGCQRCGSCSVGPVEWTPACRAGDHGFESRTERHSCRGTPW